jgi:uncharacterized repeat protein (TIGR03843 family)
MSDNDEKQPPESTPVSLERALEILKEGEIDAVHGMLRWSSNYTFLVSISHKDMTIMGIYKPREGERPLWDFPEGTLYRREVATFLTSQALGWALVPPTVVREGPRGIGSVQLFIDHDPEYNYFSFDESMAPQIKRLALFDAIINNADRKGGHCIVDSQGHLWGIDHGISFHAANKLRTVIWDYAGQSIPEPMLEDVEKLCQTLDNAESDYRHSLHELLADVEIQACHQRIKRLLKSRHYPQPGRGPNYPWPPV